MKNRVKNFVLLLIILCAAPALTAARSSEIRFYIRLNEVGYRPDDFKTAVAFGRESLPANFRVLDARSGSVAFTGRTWTVSGSWGDFDHHAELNFTQLRREGRYVIELGSTRSAEFGIGRTVNTDLGDQLLEFMREQRCGYNPYVEAACHIFDGRTAYGPLPPGTYINASGGWHDAGDQLKYLLTASNATAQMLLAYKVATESQSTREQRRTKIVFAACLSASPIPSPRFRTNAPCFTTTLTTIQPTNPRWTARRRRS